MGHGVLGVWMDCLSLHCTFAFAFQGLLESPRRLLQRQFKSIMINITINNQGWNQKNPQKNRSARRPGLNRYLSIAHCRRSRSMSPAHLGGAPRTVASSVTGHTLDDSAGPLSHGNLASEGRRPWTLRTQACALAQVMRRDTGSAEYRINPPGQRVSIRNRTLGQGTEKQRNKNLGPNIVRLTLLPVTPL